MDQQRPVFVLREGQSVALVPRLPAFFNGPPVPCVSIVMSVCATLFCGRSPPLASVDSIPGQLSYPTSPNPIPGACWNLDLTSNMLSRAQLKYSTRTI